jgi:hypothetical protein
LFAAVHESESGRHITDMPTAPQQVRFRGQSGRGARLIPRIASLTVAVIGTYWLVERIFVG